MTIMIGTARMDMNMMMENPVLVEILGWGAIQPSQAGVNWGQIIQIRKEIRIAKGRTSCYELEISLKFCCDLDLNSCVYSRCNHW